MDFDKGIELIVGPMFCGKTEELMRRLRRAEIAGRKIQVFKPDIENRYSREDLATHYGQLMPGIVVKDTDELAKNLNGETEIIGIDEIQFFDDNLIDFSRENQMKYLFILAGLSLDFEGESFKFKNSKRNIGDLMPYSKITSLSAVCNKCGKDAYFSQRLIDDSQLIVVGGKGDYEARCIDHFVKPLKDNQNP